MKIRESQIVKTLEKDFQSRGFSTFLEVPFLSRRIDLVAVSKETGDLLLVEAKVSNWKKALEQASIYLLGGEFVFIAIADDFVHRVDQDKVQGLGIGLLSVNNRVSIQIEAQRSRYQSAYYASWIREFLNNLPIYLRQEGVVINGCSSDAYS